MALHHYDNYCSDGRSVKTLHALMLGVVNTIPLVLFITVLLASAAVVDLGSSASGSVYAKSTHANTFVRLHVSSCPTSYASSPEAEGNVAASVTVSVPTAMKHDFALFTDSKRIMAPLLAPRGWHCGVEVGEDGSSSFSLFPGKHAPAQSRYSNAEEIVASSDGACQGCVADDVCPYFVNAQTQIGYTGMSCNTTKPNNEQDDYVSGSNTSNHGQVDTYDPSTKQSKYATYGVLRYDDVPGAEAEDVRETCVLPKNESSWCKAIIKEFVTENWEFRTLRPPTAPSPVASPTTKLSPCLSGNVNSTVSYSQSLEDNGSGNYNTTFYGELTNGRDDTISGVEMTLTVTVPNGSTSPPLEVSLGQPTDVSAGQTVSWNYPIGSFPFEISSATISNITYTDLSSSATCGTTQVGTTVTVPNVYGLSMSAAQALLGQSGLVGEAGSFDQGCANGAAPGQIDNSSPSPGSMVPLGGIVTLYPCEVG